jgi:hypothetical protein
MVKKYSKKNLRGRGKGLGNSKGHRTRKQRGGMYSPPATHAVTPGQGLFQQPAGPRGKGTGPKGARASKLFKQTPPVKSKAAKGALRVAAGVPGTATAKKKKINQIITHLTPKLIDDIKKLRTEISNFTTFKQFKELGRHIFDNYLVNGGLFWNPSPPAGKDANGNPIWIDPATGDSTRTPQGAHRSPQEIIQLLADPPDYKTILDMSISFMCNTIYERINPDIVKLIIPKSQKLRHYYANNHHLWGGVKTDDECNGSWERHTGFTFPEVDVNYHNPNPSTEPKCWICGGLVNHSDDKDFHNSCEHVLPFATLWENYGIENNACNELIGDFLNVLYFLQVPEAVQAIDEIVATDQHTRDTIPVTFINSVKTFRKYLYLNSHQVCNSSPHQSGYTLNKRGKLEMVTSLSHHNHDFYEESSESTLAQKKIKPSAACDICKGQITPTTARFSNEAGKGAKLWFNFDQFQIHGSNRQFETNDARGIFNGLYENNLAHTDNTKVTYGIPDNIVDLIGHFEGISPLITNNFNENYQALNEFDLSQFLKACARYSMMIMYSSSYLLAINDGDKKGLLVKMVEDAASLNPAASQTTGGGNGVVESENVDESENFIETQYGSILFKKNGETNDIINEGYVDFEGGGNFIFFETRDEVKDKIILDINFDRETSSKMYDKVTSMLEEYSFATKFVFKHQGGSLIRDGKKNTFKQFIHELTGDEDVSVESKISFNKIWKLGQEGEKEIIKLELKKIPPQNFELDTERLSIDDAKSQLILEFLLKNSKEREAEVNEANAETNFLKKFLKYYTINNIILEQEGEIDEKKNSEEINEIITILDSELKDVTDINDFIKQKISKNSGVEGTNLGVGGNMAGVVAQAGLSAEERKTLKVSGTTVLAPGIAAGAGGPSGGGGKIKTNKKKKRNNKKNRTKKKRNHKRI